MNTLETNTDLSLVEEITRLETNRDTLQEEIGETQRFLETAKADQKQTGKYIDPNEWAIARGTVRDKTNQLHAINRKLKELNKQLVARSNGSKFQKMAKGMLDPNVYQSIVDASLGK